MDFARRFVYWHDWIRLRPSDRIGSDSEFSSSRVSNVIAIAALAMFALFLLDGIQATVRVIGRRRKGSRDGEKDGFSDWSPNR